MKSESPRALRVFGRLGLGLVLLLGLCLALGAQARPAHAQTTLTVTDCSSDSQLQTDVAQANSDNAGDIITFNCSGSVDIKLSSTLTITGNMTIDGSGQSITIDGNQQYGVFQVNSGVNLTLNTLTLTNGIGVYDSDPTLQVNVGGAIYNNGGTVSITNSSLNSNSAFLGGAIFNYGGTLTLSNTTVSSNLASSFGAILNWGGTVNISNSTLNNNAASNGNSQGGAIYNGATMMITNSTLSNNSIASSTSSGGGAIWNDGMLTLTSSTLSNNSATNTGQFGGGGGGIHNIGMVSITNSTLSNNTSLSSGNFSGGGIYDQDHGTVSITNSTISNNSAPNSSGGGIEIYSNVSGAVNIAGSIVADNTASSGNDCSIVNQGTITDKGYNLESGTDCGFTGTGSLQNKDPLLDPSGLQNNGGPTQTVALQQGSPAIDQIPLANCPSTDQRGNTRPDDGETACDMGAYESSYPPPPLTLSGASVSTTEGAAFNGVVASGTYAGSGTLSASINWGDGTTSTGTVSLKSGIYSVSGSHTYAEEGKDTISIIVSDGQGQSASTSSSASVSDAALTLKQFVAGPVSHLTAGIAALFTDADPAGQVSDYTVTVNWGDGKTSTLKVTKNPQGFALASTHSYATKGTYNVTLTVTDQGGSQLTKTASVTVK